MNEYVGVKVRFGAGLLPAIANAERNNVRALQRLLSPMIYNVLQQAYVRADSETLGLGRHKLVRRFQERLNAADQWPSARADLLAQLLVAQDDRAGVHYVDQLQKAMHTRVHVQVAAHPELGALFDANSDSTTQQNDGETAAKRVRYRVRADATPAEFLHAVYLAAAQAAYDDPFLFVQDVRAPTYVENRRRCIARIGDCIDRVLYDKCNAMVNRLWREIARRVPRTAAAEPLPAASTSSTDAASFVLRPSSSSLSSNSARKTSLATSSAQKSATASGTTSARSTLLHSKQRLNASIPTNLTTSLTASRQPVKAVQTALRTSASQEPSPQTSRSAQPPPARESKKSTGDVSSSAAGSRSVPQRVGSDFSSRPLSDSHRQQKPADVDSLSSSMPATFVPREPRSNERSVQLLVRSLQPTASERAESPDVDSSSDSSSSNRERDRSDGNSDISSKRESTSNTANNISGNVGDSDKPTDKEDNQTTAQPKDGTETSADVVPTIVMSENVYRP